MTTAQAQMSLIDVMNYSNTTTFKTMLCSTRVAEGDGTYSGVEDLVTLWRSTSAINTISIFTDIADTFQAGTTFTIYGIAATSVGAKATGGTIYSDSQYYYHAFLGNGTFTPTQSISADLLVVAGGGGGAGGTSGVSFGPGGGAGQVSVSTGSSLTTTAYTVTVGGGGAGTNVNAATGAQGTSSSLASILTATGGFGGVSPLTGGAAGATYTGGIGSGSAAGGGGGSAANGGAGSGSTGGAGGNGTTSAFINAVGSATNIGQLVSSNY
jgi:hypothetical protein